MCFLLFFVAKIILDRYLYNMYALYGDVIKETMSVSATDGIVIRKFNIIIIDMTCSLLLLDNG